MTLVVNLVRTVSSAKFICCCCRNPWCDCYVTNTPKCNESAKIGQIINCVFLQNAFGNRAYDKMASIFTKRIWQPCICQPNELKREIKKKTGGPSKILGAPWPTQVPP